MAPALAAFLVLEFVGTTLSPVIGVVAGALFLAAFVTTARTLWCSPLEDGQAPAEIDAGQPAGTMCECLPPPR